MYETGRPVGKYAHHKYLRLDFFYDEYNGFVKKKAKKKKTERIFASECDRRKRYIARLQSSNVQLFLITML